jgi:hypothetical protein
VTRVRASRNSVLEIPGSAEMAAPPSGPVSIGLYYPPDDSHYLVTTEDIGKL